MPKRANSSSPAKQKRARTESSALDVECVNTIRCLAADMVQKAKSGHPGAPMGLAPLAHVLWSRVMRYNPANPKWAARDRFILSNGHGCALQYSMLHLAGYEVTMDDLKNFRQLGSITPGHPENFMTPGVEVTTGPLGQGIANGAGMALAARHLAATFNRPGFDVVDGFVYVMCGDGCMMEGVSGEAASLAGHLGLGNLIVLYDDNKISIDGPTSLSFTEDVATRFQSYGWQTLRVDDGDNDLDGLEAAIAEAKKDTSRPTLISLFTTIGFGSAKEGTEKTHGAPLGPDDLGNVKSKFGRNPEDSFVVNDDVRGVYAACKAKGGEMEAEWNAMFERYTAEHPELSAEFTRRMKGDLPAGWKDSLPKYSPTDAPIPTRKLQNQVLNAIAPVMPEIVGGSADLTPSNLTALGCSKDMQAGSYDGRYIRFGVREHGMAAMANGMAAYGGCIPYVATFLNFLSYCWPSVRLAALSHLRVLAIMTHDSIGLGEDGPTHQPIEMLALSRACPNNFTYRPADGNETVGSYICALENANAPAVMCFTRQNLPHLAGSSAEGVAKGAYVLQDCEGTPKVVLIASGSEVSLCVDAAKEASLSGVPVRVVSAPCLENFRNQSAEYRRSVLPQGAAVVAVEASGFLGLHEFAHHVVGMRSFGASAPGGALFKHFGFTASNIAETAAKVMNSGLGSAALPTQLDL